MKEEYSFVIVIHEQINILPLSFDLILLCINLERVKSSSTNNHFRVQMLETVACQYYIKNLQGF